MTTTTTVIIIINIIRGIVLAPFLCREFHSISRSRYTRVPPRPRPKQWLPIFYCVLYEQCDNEKNKMKGEVARE